VTRAGIGATLLACAVLGGVAVQAQSPETFTATASLKQGTTRASADVTVTVQRYASDQERTAVTTALRKGGTAGAQSALSTMKDAGFIQVGDRKTPIKYAGRRSTGSGQLITVVTAEPIFYLGAGVPDAKAKSGFGVAVAFLEVSDGNKGQGELAPAAKIRLDENDALVIEDYGPTVVWLTGIVRASK
jgi:hypothetical protein